MKKRVDSNEWRTYAAEVFGWRLSYFALSALALLCLQLPAEAEQQQPTKMIRIGEEIVSLEAGNAFTKAQELLNNKEFEQASALLKQFLESYPNSSAGHYKYGFALLQQGKDSEALE